MPNLLDLPSELLYHIINFVAQSPYHSLSQGMRYRPEQLRSRNVVCYPEPDLHLSPGKNLLLACRRLHTETTLYQSKNPQLFILNIAVIDGNWLWPTWKQLPFVCKAGTQERLDVNISYCETEDQRGDTNPEHSGCQETLSEVSRIVGRLLLQGPLGMSSDLPLHSPKGRPHHDAPHLRFRQLNFKVEFNHRITPPTFGQAEIPFRKVQGLLHLDFDPLYILDAKRIEDCTTMLTLLTQQALSLPHGLVLQERVDKINYVSNGEVTLEVDIRRNAERKRERDLAAYRALISQSGSAS